MKLAAGGWGRPRSVRSVSVEAVRHFPILSALFGMKAEDSELLGTAELIRGTDDLQQSPGPVQRQPGRGGPIPAILDE